MRKTRLYPLMLSTALLLSACGSTGLSDIGKNDRPIPPHPCCINPDGLIKAAHENPNSILYKQRSVYFDFDQYTVKDEYRQVLEAHGRYLAANRKIKIAVSGNTDARGSREYNLALGQKRAESVRAILVIYGVSDTQMEVISYGAEKPKSDGDGEAAWAQNRRADIEYEKR